MRGKLQELKRTNMRYRITPADAGKTVSRCINQRPRRDHPRGCGENATIKAFSADSIGITPADAGKTRT